MSDNNEDNRQQETAEEQPVIQETAEEQPVTAEAVEEKPAEQETAKEQPAELGSEESNGALDKSFSKTIKVLANKARNRKKSFK